MIGFTAPGEQKLQARDGFIDLNEALSRQPDNIFQLNGVWEFYPDELYTHEDFSAGRTKAAQLVQFPHIWTRDDGLPAKGYATYRLRMRLPEKPDWDVETSLAGVQRGKLGVYLRPQTSACRVFLDDSFLMSAGTVSKDFSRFKNGRYTERGYRDYTGDELLASGGMTCLIIQIQNEHHARPGLNGAVYIGGGQTIKHLATALTHLHGLFHGVLVMTYVTLLFLFLHGRNIISYFDYAVSSLMMLVAALTSFGENMLYRVNLFPSDTLMRIEFFAFFLGVFFIGRQVLTTWFNGKNKWRPPFILRIIYGLAAAVVLFDLFAPLELVTAFMHRIIFFSYCLAALFAVLKLILIIRKPKEVDFWFELFCQLSLLAVPVVAFFLITPWQSVEISLILFIAHYKLQAIIFLRNHKVIERNLHDLTQTLEQRIELRTRQLSEMKDKAEAATQAKSNFLANMSHEIRTPINAILGMCELALREADPRTARDYTQSIKQAGGSLLTIINDILDFSKIESGKLDIVETPYSFASLIQDCVSIIQLHISEKPIHFLVNIDPALPSRLAGDEVRVRQVLINLLSNAVKYTETGSISLEITGMRQQADADAGTGAPAGADAPAHETIITLRIQVRDTGLGIKPENMQYLFEEFSRFDTRKNRGVVGTGLGLAISRNLCRLMGGDLTAESVYTEGSTFTAFLPQRISKPDPFASVDNPAEKSVLLYETRHVYAASISTNLSALGIKYFYTDDITRFKTEIEQGTWEFAFFPSGCAESVLGFLHQTGSKVKAVVLAGIGEMSSLNDANIITMPAYALSLANALNGIQMHEPRHEEITMFTAPDIRILVVDDIVTNLKVMKGLLSPYQCVVDLCAKGAQAVKILENEYYDIVFMDHMMPDMDGIEATQKIRTLPVDYAKTVCIIALTANALSGMRELFLENGFDDYLAKPIEIAKLTEIMERWIPQNRRRPTETPANTD